MEDPNFIFSSGPIELKEEGENFFVEGHISTSDLDLVNDIVTKECIMDMAEQMRERTIKLDVEHESFRGKSDLEMEINKTIIPAAKIDDFLVDKKGLKVRAMLNRHVGRFNEVKNSIKDGFLDAFSIAFVPVKETIQEKDGQKVRMLDKINLLNVAFTGNPVNTHSTMSNVFAKSLEFLEEKAKPKKPKPQPDPHKEPEEEDEEEKGCKPKKKNHDHISDNLIKLQEVKNMTEDKEKLEAQKKAEEEAKEAAEKVEAEEKAKAEAKAEKEAAEKEAAEKEATEEGAVEGKDFEKLKAEMVEVKAALKRPMLKSKIEQVNKSGIVEEKSLNPLDVIA